MVCQACQRMLEDKSSMLGLALSNPGHRLFAHHLYPYLIELAAQGGCQICKIIWDALSDTEEELVRQAKLSVYAYRPLDGLRVVLGKPETKLLYGWTKVKASQTEGQIRFQFGNLSLRIIDIFLLPARHSFTFEVLGETMKTPTMEELVSETHVTDHMESSVNWDLIQSWIDSCSPSNGIHSVCQKVIALANADVPSRLIDLEAGDTHKAIRLSVSPEDREPKPYVTLSYTWGPNPDRERLPLLRKNVLASFTKEIPFNTVPLLFQDVIRVVRRLKFRYLWIDAFCIIQDDERDWQKEAAVMGDIYQNATLNIAAGGAVDSHSPLFTDRDPLLVRPCKVELNWLKSDVQGSFFAIAKNFLGMNLLQTPLNRRAWVLQERMLSKRILHFGKHQLFWRCCVETACETFPKEMPTSLGTDKSIFTRIPKINITDLEESLRGKDFWFHIVEMYSNCQLTMESDKLIAISGLAQAVKEKTRESNDLYLAGLWRSKLVTSLLWRVVDGKAADGKPCQRTPAYGCADYIAPSWSWASVRGKIMHSFQDNCDDYKYSSLVDVLEINVLPKDTQNVHGQVRTCSITIRGTLISALDFSWTRYYAHSATQEKHYNFFLAFTGLFRSSVACYIDDMEDFKYPNTVLSNIGYITPPPGYQLLCLISREDQDNAKDRKLWEISNFEGLIICQASVDSNKYRRVGYFKSISQGTHLSTSLGQKRSEIVLV